MKKNNFYGSAVLLASAAAIAAAQPAPAPQVPGPEARAKAREILLAAAETVGAAAPEV